MPPLRPDPDFDYLTATERKIEGRARLLRGARLGDITGATFSASVPKRGKGEAGEAIERFFGIPPNSRHEADFPGAGVELKVVPMLRSGRGLRVKERTVVSMIDYDSVVLETWATATVRGKLRILFVFFEHLPGRPKAEFPILKIVMWRAAADTESFMQADWQRVVTKIRHGRAQDLAESDGRILGPCTKGPRASVLRSQPFSSVRVKSRAWALKPAFTLGLYKQEAGESLVTNLKIHDFQTFEEQLIERFRPYIGRTIGEVGDQLGVPRSSAKSYAAQVVRRVFGVRGVKSKIKEFDEMGITLRIARLSQDLMPYEALSFPAFRYRELLEETWEDSDLLSRVEYMLIVPVKGSSKDTAQADCTVELPLFWRPSVEQLASIRIEWELFRLEIRTGRAADLTPASETSMIHVRPHSRDASDTDDAPIVGPVVKKSFWLNKDLVRSVLRGNLP